MIELPMTPARRIRRSIGRCLDDLFQRHGRHSLEAMEALALAAACRGADISRLLRIEGRLYEILLAGGMTDDRA